jgi:hypothetical protein
VTPATRSKPSVHAFISYSSRDSVLAESLKSSIEGDGISCFYAPRDILPRKVWPEELEQEIDRADLILLLYTDNAAASDEVYKEIERAHRLSKDIWLLKDPKVDLADRFRPFELGRRYQAFPLGSQTNPAVFDSLRQSIDRRFGRVDRAALGTIDPMDNPYPGTPYTSKDQDFFFGRDAECNQLLLDIYDGKEQVFFVYGPSGAGKTSLIDAGLRRLLDKRWWFSDQISASLESSDAMPIRLWRRVERQLSMSARSPDRSEATPPSDSTLPADILKAMDALAKPGYVFWFDHMEHLLALEDAKQIDFFRLAADLVERTERVRIIISFRREMLAQAEDRANLLPRGSWRKWLLRNLSTEGALDSIVRPAEKKSGVRIDGDLAKALIDALARGEGEDREGKKIMTVNPVSLQLVCGRLWTLGKPGLSRISGADLPKTGKGMETDVAEFVKHALENHLEDAIERIALKGGNQAQRKELIRLGLLQFVSEDHRRQQLKEETIGHVTRVGRLYGDMVEDLYQERLLQRTDIGLTTPDYRYELVHDSLAEAIERFRAKVDLLRTLNTLESTLRGVGSISGCFNRNANLLADLEGNREGTAFFDDEKEFLFRCALGNQRRSIRKEHKEQISLEGWARLLADGNIDTFEKVMREALSPAVCPDDSVRRDAIALMMQPEFRNRLKPEQLEGLGGLMVEVALSAPEEVQQAACLAVCEMCNPPGAVKLFGLLTDGAQRTNARHAVAWVRHAADCREIPTLAAGEAFEGQWRKMTFGDRIRILIYLWVQRAVQSFGWMAFAAFMATIFTATFACLAFLPMGFWGAALTLGDKAAGAIKGGFHGVAGGTFWGSGISTALLVYWVILRGGRVASMRTDWVKAALAACAGGFVAGIALSFVLGFVFQAESLYNAGWLCTDAPLRLGVKLNEIFIQSRHGWITPIFGIAVAAGIAWSLQRITADPRTEAYFRQQPSAIQRPSQAFAAIWRILKLVSRRWWCHAISLTLGGVVVFALLRPGPGVCDARAVSRPLGVCAADARLYGFSPCDFRKHPGLAPMWARVAGMAFIISIGGISLETGLLFGILAARVGVKLERDEHFLQTLPAKT